MSDEEERQSDLSTTDKSTLVVAQDLDGLSESQIQRHVRDILRSIEGKWNPALYNEHVALFSQRVKEGRVGPRELNKFIAILQRDHRDSAAIVIKLLENDTNRAMKMLDKVVPDQVVIDHTHHTTDARGEVTELLQNADYLEYLREKAVREDSDAGAVRALHDGRNGRAVANGSPPSDPGPGTNGDRGWRK